MHLSKLLKKRNLIILGLNSGTSADGLDFALIKATRSRNQVSYKFINGFSKKYPQNIKANILDISNKTTVSLDEIISLDNGLGNFMGKATSNYLDKIKQQKIKVDLIASHGQTIRHIPQKTDKLGFKGSGTMQLGSLEIISSLTGKITTGDFRQADIALGNEGAPITVSAMSRLFSHKNESRLIVNIGGISNFFYFPSQKLKKTIKAADCGPGNSLSDIFIQKKYNKNYDLNGNYAKKGVISARLLTLLDRPKSVNNNTVSTGREQFGVDLVDFILNKAKKINLSNYDILATIGELTAILIAKKVKPLLKQDKFITKLYLTGGGRKNKFFIQRIQYHLKDIEIRSIDEFGIDGGLVEAASYAVMGEATIRSESMSTLYGNRKQNVFPVLGKIVQPPEYKNE